MADKSADLKVNFPGGKKVDVKVGDFVIKTDQNVKNGGEASAPEPFDLFLASLGACAGIYVVSFCQKRNIPTENIEITEKIIRDEEKKRIAKVELNIITPPDFPEKYHKAVIRAASGCAVKKYLEAPFEVETVISQG